MAKEKKREKKKKGFNISKLTLDEKKESEGIWKEFGEGLMLKIARFGNKAYSDFMDIKSRPHLKGIRKGNLTTAKIILRYRDEAISKFILVDWENMLDDVDGKEVEIKYSSEKALEYINKHEELNDFVIEVSQEYELFRLNDLEESSGNSPAA